MRPLLLLAQQLVRIVLRHPSTSLSDTASHRWYIYAKENVRSPLLTKEMVQRIGKEGEEVCVVSWGHFNGIGAGGVRISRISIATYTWTWFPHLYWRDMMRELG